MICYAGRVRKAKVKTDTSKGEEYRQKYLKLTLKADCEGTEISKNYFNYTTDCRKSEFFNLLQIPQAEEHLTG